MDTTRTLMENGTVTFRGEDRDKLRCSLPSHAYLALAAVKACGGVDAAIDWFSEASRCRLNRREISWLHDNRQHIVMKPKTGVCESNPSDSLAALQVKMMDLEARVDTAFEEGRIALAEDLDVQLAEVRQQLDDCSAQTDYDFEEDASDFEVGVEEQLVARYQDLLNLRNGEHFSSGFPDEENVLANMRDVLDVPGAGLRENIPDAEIIEAAKDAYQARRRIAAEAEIEEDCGLSPR